MSEPGDLLTVTELERALDGDGLVPVYQPCYDLRTGVLVAVEALARLREPAQQELISPARFISTAEESGLVARLDLMMMEQAFRQVARWRRTPMGGHLCVAVNLSPADLDDPLIADRIRDLAERAGLPIDAVIIELTETVLAQAARGHDAALAAISGLGCNVTLDDFGTGNASFGYLQRFRVNGLKIDRSFVQMLGEGGADERLAESLVRFCLSLNLHVVAEGIEEPSQVAALRRLGCHFGQGFHLACPMTAEQLEAALYDGSLGPPGLGRPAERAPAVPAPATVESNRSRTTPLAVLVVLLMACLTLLTVGGQWRSENSLHQAARDRLATIDSLAAGQVDKNIVLIRDAVVESSGRRDARLAVQGNDRDAMEEELGRIMATPGEIFSASLYDAAGTMLALEPEVPGVVGENFAFRDWYRGARAASGPYVSEAFQLKTPEQPWAIAVATALRDGSDQPVGFVVATYSLAGLQEELATALGSHGITATLVDQRGTILAAPQSRLVGQRSDDPRLRAAEAAAGEDGEVQWVVRSVPALGGWLLAEQSRADLAQSPTLGRLMTGLVAFLAMGGIVLVLLWARADRRRRRLEAELGAAHGWLASILTATPTPLVVCDETGRVQTANAAMAVLLGSTTEELEGADLRAWLPLEGQPRSDEGVVATTVVSADGEVRAVEVRSQLLGDPQGRPMHLHTVVDVTPHREEHDRLRAQGRTDPLTGVGNRRALREAVAAAMEDSRSSYALVMMDLDRFKPVNDTLGHAVGDELLSVVAATLSDAVRPGDTVTRVGGDEFVTVVRLPDPVQSDAVAERLRTAVAAALAMHPAARDVGVGVSAGTAVVGRDAAGLDDLLFVADQRMYAAKRAGRPA